MSDNVNVLEILEKGLNDLKEQRLLEEKRMEEIKERAFNFNDSLMSEEDLKFAEEISNTFFDGISNELTAEQKGQLQSMSVKQRVATAGAIWGSINAMMMAQNFAQGMDSVDIKGIVSKTLLNPIQTLAIGNVIYKGIQDFKDGVTTGEIFTFIKDGAPSVISTGKFIYGLYQIKTSPDIPGEGFLDKMKNYYFDTNTVNVIKPKEFNSYTLNLDTDGISLQRYIQSSELSNIVALPEATSISGVDGGITGGTFKPLEGVDDSFKNLNVDVEVPKTGFEKIKSAASSLMQYADLVVQIGSLAADIYSIADTVDKGETVTASQIMGVISSSLGTIGSAVSFAGPIGQVVGAVISGVGSIVSACRSFAELNSESTSKDVLFAIGDFLGGLVPILPSIRAIEQALTYEELKDSATNEIDRQIYGALHTIAALDATPIINFTHFIYEPVIKDDTRDDLIESFGSFDNMMHNYITSDIDFNNNLDKISEYLKQNGNTEHTQYISAYLTPEQIKIFFGDESYYKPGYDIRNVDKNLSILNNTANGVELKEISGLSTSPVGQGVTTKGDRTVLKTISLGYGVGKDLDQTINNQNARRVDTSTYFGYSKSELTPYKEFGKAVWLDFVDDMSGKTITYPQNTVLPNINNRIRAVATDVIYADISTGKGDDDVIYTDIVRANENSSSKIVLRADGGEGDDILDLSHIMHDSIKRDANNKNEVFNFNYSIKDNILTSVKSNSNGKDHDMIFKNFETIALTDAKNNFSIVSGTDIVPGDATVKELRLSGVGATENKINLKDIKSVSLRFEGSTDANNLIDGTINNDVIQILDVPNSKGIGKMSIHGYEGNDFIKGGNVQSSQGGQNLLYGDAGNDVLVADGDNTIIDGGAGDDMIFGSTKGIGTIATSKEIIHGGDGDDYIDGGGKLNTYLGVVSKKTYEIYGDAGNDIINLTNGNVNEYGIIDGGDGIDILDLGKAEVTTDYVVIDMLYNSLLGFDQNVTVQSAKARFQNFENVYGSNTRDWIVGDMKNNILKGRDGDDTLKGEKGDDTLYGEVGNDTLDGGFGVNYLYGGEGSDRFVAEEIYKDSYNIIMDFNVEDEIKLDVEDFTEVQFRRAKVRDPLTGSISDSLVLITQNKNNIVINDWYNKGLDANELKITIFNDIVLQSDLVAKRVADAKLINEYLEVFEEDKTQIIEGTQNNDLLDGNIESNIINGRDGNDAIFGKEGHDLITGGNGDDIISGESGKNILYGGAGSDTFSNFYKVSSDNMDIIMDFDVQDKIKFNDVEDLVLTFFKRATYVDPVTKKNMDSLLISYPNKNNKLVLSDWFNKGQSMNDLKLYTQGEKLARPSDIQYAFDNMATAQSYEIDMILDTYSKQSESFINLANNENAIFTSNTNI